MSFLGSSLSKSTDAVKTCFQHRTCSDNSSGFHLSDHKKTCQCCNDLFDFRKDGGGVLCDFSKNFFNDEKFVNDLTRKAPFPYSKLDELLSADRTAIVEEVMLHPIPPRSEFLNELADSKGDDESRTTSPREYNELIDLTTTLGIDCFGDLLLLYNCVDTLLVLLNLFAINRFYFQHFGLSILRYSSLSKYGFDVLMQGVQKEYGRGVEGISSPDLLEFLKDGNFGGLSSFLKCGGRPEYANLAELIGFLKDNPQSAKIFVDVNSLFPFSMLGLLPMANYYLHQAESKLVVEMNRLLKSKGAAAFVDHFEKEGKRTSTLYLLRVDIRYPHSTHVNLMDLVPTVRKRVVKIDELSPAQRDCVNRMDVKPSTKDPIMMADLHPQTITVTLCYLSLLVRLGVEIRTVVSVATAFGAPYFKTAATKILDLKKTAKIAHLRALAKQLINACYGMCLMRIDLYSRTRLAFGSRQMISALGNPGLKLLN